ncbi:uncharacterized protein LOC141912450 [Tubulanus polymorphus]|uniref:uncharacterized protein LOC141912450 n=1 Tax=Tubulanus polymorphus TaxID=672921 RepID=UPI003DA45CEA
MLQYIVKSSSFVNLLRTVTVRNLCSRHHVGAIKPLLSKHKISRNFSLSTWNKTEFTDENSDEIKKDIDVQDWMKEITSDFSDIGVNSEHDENDEFIAKDYNLKEVKATSVIDNESEVEINENERTVNDLEDEYEDFQDFSDFSGVGEVHYEKVVEKVHPISFEPGEYGVFDVDDLVAALKYENALDISVIDIPPSKRYVDHMVIASGKSTRHLLAVAKYIRWLYKQRCEGKQPPKIEGADARDRWLALDLGNIALHLFLPEVREIYDLETLWTLGDEQHDNHEDPFATLFDQPTSSSDDNSQKEDNVKSK